ncbi:hypothetical protein RHMOL_Rhmol07G0308400 [Rhododendron molle]|uniref:Uncharacterized protein n=1 Tax=Rhododendron molle TaxID=49168 RepID=A0ACC0N6R9_RHOML|nr:hypothetical protein RHMOL_Rhmol07G0308400 [Rhododendron molle]
MPRNREETLGGLFTIRIHHGGKFFNRPTIRYEGGCVEACENCIPDVMSLITVGDIVGTLGYTGMINYYYVMTGKNINNGLRMLLTDNDVIEMIKQLPQSRIVDMYVEPIIPIEMMESQTDDGGPTPTPTDKGSPTETQNEGCPTQNDKGSRTEKDCPTETDKGSRSDKEGPTQTDKGARSDKGGLSQPDKGSKSDKGGPNETDKGSKSDKGGPRQCGKSSRSDKRGPTDKGGPLHDVNYEDLLVDDALFEDGFCDATTYDGVDVQDLDDRTSESDVSFEVDSDYEQSDDDGLYEANVDEEAEWVGFDNSKGKEPNLNDDLDDDDDGKDYGDDSSDDLHSACSNSDDDRKKDKFQEYRRETDLGKVQFTVGMKFPSAKEFREAVREYSIKEGKDIKFVKNETTRVKAKCATEECGWSVMPSVSQKGESFQVKSHKSEHDCLRSFKVRHVTSMYLAEKYVDSIRSNPNMPLDHLQQRVRKDLVVDISHTQAYRAKRKALDLIEGTNLEQFARLRDYCEEIRRTNPNTTIIMKTIPSPTPDGQPIFERIYVCLGALKQGMLAGCRRLVCMDACHLKEAHGGQLLVAVGIDANNQSFPFAYAVAESETKETWTWFLELVVEDLQIQNTSAWTFMTDKQKGLVPALQEIVPNAEMRFCTRHLFTNFRDSHKGMELRKQLWAAARATTVTEFHKAMDLMRTTDVEAYKWLAEKPASQWSRSHFSTFNTCDILVNNLCEGFNKDIRKARDKPIITLLEGIRCYLMTRMAKRRDKITKWENCISPNVIKKLEKYKRRVGGCNPIWCGEGHFQIHCPPPEQYSLNLLDHTCSCRRWDLKGIPCVHAIVAITFKNENILDYCHPCYGKETNANIYKGIIYPINGWTMWPSSGCVPVLPPNYGRPSGRPKKSRRKEREELENPDADKLKRQNTSLRCGKCGQWGHNIRSCKNEVNPDIRRRPSGGLVFSRPTGKPRGRPRQGGSQASSSRGRGLVAAPTEGGQPLRGRGGAGRGRGGAGRGRGDGGRGMTDGERGRGDGGRGRTDGGMGRTVGRGRGYGRGRASQPPPPAAAAEASQPPAQ